MWPFVVDAPSGVEMIMLVACLLMGLSHLLQPQIWVEFFGQLRGRGSFGLVANSFINAAPAAVIVSLHQVWTGPAVMLTLYGWALLIKSGVSLLVPSVGLRSMALARHGDGAFRAAGVGLLAVALACALQLGGIAVP